MQRSCSCLLALFVALGCRAGTEHQERVKSRTAALATTPAQSSAAAPSETSPHADTLPGTLFADLERATAPIHAKLETMVLTLRADSGSVKADSDYRQLRSGLNSDIEAVGKVAWEHDLEGLFHLNWMSEPMQAVYLKKRGVADSTVAQKLVDSVYRFLASRAVKTQDGEGGPGFDVADDSVLKSIGRFLSPAGREYLVWSRREQAEPAADDGYLKISGPEFADRIAMMDHIASAYPSSPFAEGMVRERNMRLHFYLGGAEGPELPVPELPPAAKANIDYFLAKYGSTPAAVIVRGYVAALKTRGYREGKTLEEYFEKLP
jgi:hypothetical protein